MSTTGRAVCTLVAISCLHAAAPSQAREPEPSIPSGKWSVQGDNGACILSRTFMSANGQVLLSIEPFTTGTEVDLSLKVAGRYDRIMWRLALISFGNDQRPVKAHALLFNSVDASGRVSRMELDRTDLDRAVTTELITINVDGVDPVQMSLSNVRRAVATLDDCRRTLVMSVRPKGTDPIKIDRQPEPPQTLFRRAPGYFEAAAKADLEDEAIARYSIDETGTLIDCSVIRKANDDRLNMRACHSWGSAKFSPANDEMGRAIQGLYFERERWIPKEQWGLG